MEELRGFIESEIDKIIQEKIIEDVEWVQKETSISSLKDLALGHMIGTLRGSILGIGASRTTEDYVEIQKKARAILKGKLPDIIQKIEEELEK